MSTAVLTAPSVTPQYRELLDEITHERVARRIAKDHPELTLEQAQQIMDATIGFLVLCRDYPELSFEPSSLVDIGWHTFLLYTQEYAEFCQQQVGFFVHHTPSDMPGVDYSADGPIDTAAFMLEHGIVHDADMWDTSATCVMDVSGPRPRPRPSGCSVGPIITTPSACSSSSCGGGGGGCSS